MINIITSYFYKKEASIAPLQEPLALARGHLLKIFQTIKTGQKLPDSDAQFLRDTSTARSCPSLKNWLFSFFSTSSDTSSIRELETLSTSIFNKTLPNKNLLSQTELHLSSKTQPTENEVTALAKLLNSWMSRVDSFETTLEQFKSEKTKPTRGELINLVERFNTFSLPQNCHPNMSQKILIFNQEFGTHKQLEVRSDTLGHLEIIDGPIAPLDIRCQQTLTKDQIKSMKTLYQELVGSVIYNNLGELLEFVHYFKTKRTEDPLLSAKTALDYYTPNLPQIFEKHKTGTCILLASKFSQELKKQGITVQIVGHLALNFWSSVPIPGMEESPLKWNNYSKSVNEMEHTTVVCCFLNEEGFEEVLEFKCSFEKDNRNDIQVFSGTQKKSGIRKYLEEHYALDSEYRPCQILDLVSIGKNRLKGRFKAVITKDNKFLGVDLLKEAFYINPSWSRKLKDIPLNSDNIASIKLSDLSTPDQMGTYSINGEKTQLTHRDALSKILNQAREHMVIPDDTEENIIALALIQETLFTDFFLEPLPLIKTHYQDLSIIGKIIKKLDLKANDPDTSTPDLKKTLDHYLIKFHTLQDEIIENKLDVAKMIQLKQELTELTSF